MANKEEETGFLSRLISYALRFRLVVLLISAFTFVYGIYTLSHAKYDIYPEFIIPQVVIQTEAPGLTSIQVEQLVTTHLETALLGTKEVTSVLSTSIQGLSVITVFFESDKNIYTNRQMIAERLATVTPLLPKNIVPVMTPLSSSAGNILTVGMTSEQVSLMDMKTIADWQLIPKILAVPGVSSVVAIGGETEQLQVQVELDALIKHRLSLQDVVNQASLATEVQGGGVIDTFNQRINIQTEGQALTPEELGKAVLTHIEGVSVTLDQVGKVKKAPATPFGASSIMGIPGVILQVEMQYQENTLEVTKSIDQALQELIPSIEKKGISFYPNLFRPATFIQLALKNIEIALLIGVLLVTVILCAFLLNWKTVLIAMIAIPLSIMAAVIVLQYQNVSLNIMTLGGLAIAIGLLVDDAVITVENIFRRVRENNAVASPRPISSVVLNATLEVRGAVVYATLAIVLVFLPVLTLTGVAGRLFGPLVVAYISATFASLIVALLVTPVLSLLLISGAKKEPVTIRWLKEKYKKLLDRMERLTVPILIAATVFLVGGFLTLFFVHRTYLPPMNENFLVLHLDFAPGTSLEESIRVGKLVTDDLLKIDGVQSVGQRAGRGELGEDIHGTHQSELDISVSSKNVAQLIEKMRDLLSQYPGTHYEIDSFLMERINDTLSGYVADFIINVFGNNFDELDAAASQIAEKLASIPGAKDILIQSPPGTPEVTIGLRKDDLRQWGLQTADVLNTISTAFQGKTVGQIYQDNRIIDVVVILDPKERDQPDKARHLLLKSPSNQYIELEQVADIFTDSGRYNIEHQGGRRVMPVTCNISGVSVRAFEDQVRSQIISKLNLPSGMYVEIQGVAAAEKTAENQLLFNSLIAALIILALLYMILGSFPYLLLLLCNLPFALVGGILSLFFMQGILSVGSMIGFVTVFGITLRNSIMIALHAQHLVIYEGKPWNRDTVIQSVQERLAPILMTALATAFGLLPIALENGRPGNEIESPVAIVILGGLITSTLLNLLILPLLMLRFSRSLTPQKNKSSEEI